MKRTLTVTFDVTDWSYSEVAALAGEAEVQGESNDDHPDARLVSNVIDPPFTEEEMPPRTVLVHLNVAVPGSDARSSTQIADSLMAALYVGLEGAPEEDQIPPPYMALAEEV